MSTLTAIYTRVSTSQQSTRSQKPDLQRWIDSQDPDTLGQVKWFHDSATGKNMDRPGWQKLQKAIDVKAQFYIFFDQGYLKTKNYKLVISILHRIYPVVKY